MNSASQAQSVLIKFTGYTSFSKWIGYGKFFITAVTLTLLAILTACGGGGGGGTPSSSVVDSTFIKTVKTDFYFGAFIAQGKFKNDGNTYVLVTGSQIEKGGTVPVNIFKLSENGGGVDVTTEILGPNVPTVSTFNLLVADFNNDGVDDIFLPGMTDIPSYMTESHLFLSRPGTYHSHRVLESTWAHGAYAADINSDGSMDVIDSNGMMWINDGAGNFTYKYHMYDNSLFWMNGMGVCVGDFLNDGRKQVIITDLNIGPTTPVGDTALFELDANLKPIARHLLPTPIYDVGNTTLTEKSHDVRCRIADMNNDGLKDIVVFSRPWASARNDVWAAEGQIQILINQGNLNFSDQTNLVGFDANTNIDYAPILYDFNGDGIPDIWSSPQLLVSGSGTWTRRNHSQNPNKEISYPIKINGKWGFVYTNGDGTSTNVYFTKPNLSIGL